MPVEVICPKCDAAFRVPETVLGKKGKCPACKEVIVAEKPDRADGAPARGDASARGKSGELRQSGGPSRGIPRWVWFTVGGIGLFLLLVVGVVVGGIALTMSRHDAKVNELIKKKIAMTGSASRNL